MTDEDETQDFPKEWLMGETLGRVDVARIFNVDPATVIKWSRAGLLGYFRTPAGKRVYPECEVKRLMRGDPPSDFVKQHAERDTAKFNRRWREGWHRGDNAISWNYEATHGPIEDPDE